MNQETRLTADTMFPKIDKVSNGFRNTSYAQFPRQYYTTWNEL